MFLGSLAHRYYSSMRLMTSGMRASMIKKQIATKPMNLRASMNFKSFLAEEFQRPDNNLKSEPGYLYHATNEESLRDIKDSGWLEIFGPVMGPTRRFGRMAGGGKVVLDGTGHLLRGCLPRSMEGLSFFACLILRISSGSQPGIIIPRFGFPLVVSRFLKVEPGSAYESPGRPGPRLRGCCGDGGIERRFPFQADQILLILCLGHSCTESLM
jgi:hypothetical protein